MFRWIIALSLGLSILAFGGPRLAVAQGDQTIRERKAEKIKAKVLKLGTGEKVKVKVKLNSGVTHKGYISASNNDGFALVENKGQQHSLRYSDVDSVDRQGMSVGKKIAIGIGIGLAALITVALVAVAHFGD
jgi:hypothetical protein